MRRFLVSHIQQLWGKALHAAAESEVTAWLMILCRIDLGHHATTLGTACSMKHPVPEQSSHLDGEVSGLVHLPVGALPQVLHVSQHPRQFVLHVSKLQQQQWWLETRTLQQQPGAVSTCHSHAASCCSRGGIHCV